MILHSHDEDRATYGGNLPSTKPAAPVCTARWTITRLVLLALVVGALTWWVFPARAEAITRVIAPSTSRWVQPYGGCKEAYVAPRSRGAKECRRHGWLVKRWVVASPRGVVRYISGPAYQLFDSGYIYVGRRWNMAMTEDGVVIARRVTR